MDGRNPGRAPRPVMCDGPQAPSRAPRRGCRGGCSGGATPVRPRAGAGPLPLGAVPPRMHGVHRGPNRRPRPPAPSHGPDYLKSELARCEGLSLQQIGEGIQQRPWGQTPMTHGPWRPPPAWPSTSSWVRAATGPAPPPAAAQLVRSPAVWRLEAAGRAPSGLEELKPGGQGPGGGGWGGGWGWVLLRPGPWRCARGRGRRGCRAGRAGARNPRCGEARSP